MKLGFLIGYLGVKVSLFIDKVLEVESFGFDFVWMVEVYGFDVVSFVVWIFVKIMKIKVGIVIM